MATELIECPMCRQQIECDLNDTADDPISRMTGDAMPRALKNHFDEHVRAGREALIREMSPDMRASAEEFFDASADEVQAMFASSGTLIGKPTEADLAELEDAELVELVWNNVSLSPEPQGPEMAAIFESGLLRIEHDNGGLVQWFQNTRGQNIEAAREALTTIGADYHLAVWERAVAIYEREKLMPDSWWIEELDHRAYESDIEGLDDEFGTPHLSTVEAAYIRANAAVFLA